MGRSSWIEFEGLVVASTCCLERVVQGVSGGSRGLQREQSAVDADTLAVAGSVAAAAAGTAPGSSVLCLVVD